MDAMGDPDSWDKDDPEGSIQEYLESQGLEDVLKGHRPVSVTVDDMGLVAVEPASKGAQELPARPKFKLKSTFTRNDGSTITAWWWGNHWRHEDQLTPLMTTADAQGMATAMTKLQAEKVMKQFAAEGKLSDFELVPVT